MKKWRWSGGGLAGGEVVSEDLGEIGAGELGVAAELGGAIGFNQGEGAVREAGEIKTNQVKITTFEGGGNEVVFGRGELTGAGDFDGAGGFAAFDAGEVNDLVTDGVDAEFLLDVQTRLDEPGVVKLAVAEIKKDVLGALGDTGLGEVAAGSKAALAGEMSNGVEVAEAAGLEVFVLGGEHIVETADVVNTLGGSVVGDEVVKGGGVGDEIGVVEGVTEIDQLGRRERGGQGGVGENLPAGGLKIGGGKVGGGGEK